MIPKYFNKKANGFIFTKQFIFNGFRRYRFPFFVEYTMGFIYSGLIITKEGIKAFDILFKSGRSP